MADTVNDNEIVEDFIEDVDNEGSLNKEQIRQYSYKELDSNAQTAKELDNVEHITDIWLKRIYGIGILSVLLGWVACVLVFMFKQINPNENLIHHVSDAVFITLLTTATANIIALPAIILKYLFPKRQI